MIISSSKEYEKMKIEFITYLHVYFLGMFPLKFLPSLAPDQKSVTALILFGGSSS